MMMRMRSNKLLVFVLFLALTPHVYAKDNTKSARDAFRVSSGCGTGDIRDMFYKANAMYEYSEYNKAVSQYKKIIDEGWVNGSLFYNLGNCYFKEGKLGKAILNYEKARRFIPRDSDLESNYKYVKSLIKGGAGREKENFIDRLFAPFTIDEAAILLSVLYLAVLFIAIAGLYIKPIRRYRLFSMSILAIVFIMASIAMYGKRSKLGKEAIVIKENTDVRFEPFGRATVYFNLYEGAKVKVLSSQKNWCRIKRWDGKAGWVKKKDIEIF